jgi:hypothetical protein
MWQYVSAGRERGVVLEVRNPDTDHDRGPGEVVAAVLAGDIVEAAPVDVRELDPIDAPATVNILGRTYLAANVPTTVRFSTRTEPRRKRR